MGRLHAEDLDRLGLAFGAESFDRARQAGTGWEQARRIAIEHLTTTATEEWLRSPGRLELLGNMAPAEDANAILARTSRTAHDFSSLSPAVGWRTRGAERCPVKPRIGTAVYAFRMADSFRPLPRRYHQASVGSHRLPHFA